MLINRRRSGHARSVADEEAERVWSQLKRRSGGASRHQKQFQQADALKGFWSAVVWAGRHTLVSDWSPCSAGGGDPTQGSQLKGQFGRRCRKPRAALEKAQLFCHGHEDHMAAKSNFL